MRVPVGVELIEERMGGSNLGGWWPLRKEKCEVYEVRVTGVDDQQGSYAVTKNRSNLHYDYFSAVVEKKKSG